MNSQKKYEIDINNYKNPTLIQKGRYGSIYSIQKQNTDQFYAAKVINCDRGEAQIQKTIDLLFGPLVRLNHPTIIKYYGYSLKDFDGKDNITLIMDLVKNDSLANFIEGIRASSKEVFYNNTSRQKILIGIARGLAYLHSHNISNIYITPTKILLDKNFHPLISNYGLLKLYQELNASDAGNPNIDDLIYVAPEVLSDHSSTDKSDVYSFGIIMYEIITGLIPFPKFKNHEITESQFKNKIISENYRPEFSSAIKPSIKSIIEQCWSADPKLRPSFENLFTKLAYNSEDSDNKISDEKQNDDKYYLDEVDKSELLSYADLITGNDTISVKNKPKSPVKNKNSIDISKFNSLPIKSQQITISKLINDLSNSDESEFLTNINNLLLYILQFNCNDSLTYVEIPSQEDDDVIDESVNSIRLRSSATEILYQKKLINSEEFINILTKFDVKRIELKYPTKTFSDVYNTISEVQKTQINDLKIEIFITGIRQTDEMFTCKTNIDSITIDNSLTTIGWNAFSGCISLTHISIPESVKIIEKGAFLECSSLTSISIPESVTEIGDRAFYECKLLEEIIIPSSVTKIGKAVFYMCNSLKSIKIPDSITLLDDGTFVECTSLSEISLPSSLKAIGQCCFSKCSSLTQITIPDTVTTIVKGAFHGCETITEITMPPLITEIEDHLFQECYSLQKVNIPESVKSIGICSFCHCSSLTDIKIPSTITSIGKGAFYGCLELKKIDLPSTIELIDLGTFQNCESLTEFVIPDSVTEIGICAFRECNLLSKISIPSSVKLIGIGAFYNCSKLVEISIPLNVPSIDICTFQGCSSLKKITIPSSVKEIGKRAFDSCTSLSQLTIPSSVDSIGKFAFNRCNSLKSINIPSSVTSVGKKAFPKKTKVVRK